MDSSSDSTTLSESLAPFRACLTCQDQRKTTSLSTAKQGVENSTNPTWVPVRQPGSEKSEASFSSPHSCCHWKPLPCCGVTGSFVPWPRHPPRSTARQKYRPCWCHHPTNARPKPPQRTSLSPIKGSEAELPPGTALTACRASSCSPQNTQKQNSLGITETSQILTPSPRSCLAPEGMRGNFGWVELELRQRQEEEEAAAALGCALPAASSPERCIYKRGDNRPKTLSCAPTLSSAPLQTPSQRGAGMAQYDRIPHRIYSKFFMWR